MPPAPQVRTRENRGQQASAPTSPPRCGGDVGEAGKRYVLSYGKNIRPAPMITPETSRTTRQ
jgi:hypothetical protein